MKYVIQIEDSNPENKSLIEYLRSLASAGKKIKVLTEDELEEAEDQALLQLMDKGRESGHANTDEVLKFLDPK